MTRDIIRMLQRHLASLGHYAGEIDGVRGDLTAQAVRAALGAHASRLPADWQDWSEKRQFVALLQIFCTDEGAEPGPIDGWYGPQTDFAANAVLHKQTHGSLPDWRDTVPSDANPNGWPTEAGVPRFYGAHGNPDWSRPPPPLVKVTSPYQFKLAWNKSQKRSFLWAHEKTADSLSRVLTGIFQHYGQAEIERLSIDVFSGDYHPRLKKGSSTQWSMHAWGIAYDFDDEHNKLHWGADRARLARPDYIPFWNIWESEGWVSLGRAKNFDWMHVQAARVS